MMMSTPRVTEPDKELRFTRSGQALGFWFLAMAFVASAMVILVAASGRDTDFSRIHQAWAVMPVILAWLACRIAIHLTKHAYLILTPLGIEIFPLIRPAHGMRMIPWAEIDAVEIDRGVRRITLHFDSARTSGVHLTLRPIREHLRPLLVEAMIRRVKKS